MGIADLLAALRKPQKRFQDAGRGPGSAAHPMGNGGQLGSKMQVYITQNLPLVFLMWTNCLGSACFATAQLEVSQHTLEASRLT